MGLRNLIASKVHYETWFGFVWILNNLLGSFRKQDIERQLRKCLQRVFEDHAERWWHVDPRHTQMFHEFSGDLPSSVWLPANYRDVGLRLVELQKKLFFESLISRDWVIFGRSFILWFFAKARNLVAGGFCSGLGWLRCLRSVYRRFFLLT